LGVAAPRAGSVAAAVRLCSVDDAGCDPLLAKHAPQLIIFPEAIDNPEPPWPARTHDYHPRPVWIFIDRSRLVQRGGIMWWVTPPRAINSLAFLGRTVEPHDVGIVFGIVLVALSFVVATIQLLNFTAPGHTYPPPDASGLASAMWESVGVPVLTLFLWGISMVGMGLFNRARIRGNRFLHRNQIRRRVERAWPRELARMDMSLRGGVDQRIAWRSYRHVLRQSSENYPRTVYSRTVSCGASTALQYWFFYFFDDWQNIHEADWELATVLLDTETLTVREVCLSAHDRGTRRQATEVLWNDAHPVVYVALGSHALYFGPNASGYLPTLMGHPVPIGARDWVPFIEHDTVSTLSREEYRLVEMPDATGLDPTSADWSEWWWLAYGGMWGRMTPIRGPVFQAPKWGDPLAWAATLAEDG
jgi:hypothetical protein